MDKASLQSSRLVDVAHRVEVRGARDAAPSRAAPEAQLLRVCTVSVAVLDQTGRANGHNGRNDDVERRTVAALL
jgi:hypothetical protein